MKQLSFLDIVSHKERDALTPEVWGCTKTCANFTNKYSNGSRDYFPGTHEPRCTRSHETGSFKSKLVDNVWITKCKFYEPKEK